ncbi:MAG: tetraacyldisaccharide 4'-kinase [Saprospiraceae bacterium]|nr:tetraacyldisaccharide 4'-kinase [Lewinella sp.]
MVQSKLVKVLLAPFSLLYGLIMSLRDFFYRKGLLKSVEFNLPVISVGNLSVGGAGKTPHIEYIILLLRDYINIATLSRGYRRKTRGYLEVQPRMTVEEVGDEPLQFKRKFPDIMVTVSESRSFGIPQIVSLKPETQLILLDDAFQHRSVQPGLNILLTEFNHPFTRDYLLPSGRLREWRSGYERADIIVVSKCPPELSEAQRDAFIEEINPLPHQQLYFSYYRYFRPYYIFDGRYRARLEQDWDVLLISAIARTEYLTDYLSGQAGTIRSLEFEDHHYFTKSDMGDLKRAFDQLSSPKKIIITTEKDAMRMESHRQFLVEQRLPIFVLPVQVQFHFNQGAQFDEQIKNFLLNFKV